MNVIPCAGKLGGRVEILFWDPVFTDICLVVTEMMTQRWLSLALCPAQRPRGQHTYRRGGAHKPLWQDEVPRCVSPPGKTPPTASCGSGAPGIKQYNERQESRGAERGWAGRRTHLAPAGLSWPARRGTFRSAQGTVNLCVTPTWPGGVETPSRNYSGRVIGAMKGGWGIFR